jgi:hypothetical protein
MLIRSSRSYRLDSRSDQRRPTARNTTPAKSGTGIEPVIFRSVDRHSGESGGKKHSREGSAGSRLAHPAGQRHDESSTSFPANEGECGLLAEGEGFEPSSDGTAPNGFRDCAVVAAAPVLELSRLTGGKP